MTVWNFMRKNCKDRGQELHRQIVAEACLAVSCINANRIHGAQKEAMVHGPVKRIANCALKMPLEDGMSNVEACKQNPTPFGGTTKALCRGEGGSLGGRARPKCTTSEC